jgi:hypothetical protein
MLTQEQLDLFEEQITAAIDAHLARGGKLMVGGFYGADPNTLCPISCMTGACPKRGYDEALSRELSFDISYNEMFEFINGFDTPTSFQSPTQDSPLFRLGRKLREKYLP